jgi:superoxide dismutase, Cu-Zn family
MPRIPVVPLLLVLASACATPSWGGHGAAERTPPEATAALEEAAEVLAIARISGLEGRPIRGEAVFARIGDRVDLVVLLEGAPPGLRAFHIHEGTDCDAPGGHWNPTGETHGQWGDPEGFHLGDIGNIEVGADGTAFRTHGTDLWALGEGGALDPVGQTVIVHEGHDTYEPPTGHAGDPIACGVIERVRPPPERPEPTARAR